MDGCGMNHFSRVVLNDWVINVRIILQLARFCKLHFWVCVWFITATVKATVWGTFDLNKMLICCQLWLNGWKQLLLCWKDGLCCVSEDYDDDDDDDNNNNNTCNASTFISINKNTSQTTQLLRNSHCGWPDEIADKLNENLIWNLKLLPYNVTSKNVTPRLAFWKDSTKIAYIFVCTSSQSHSFQWGLFSLVYVLSFLVQVNWRWLEICWY